MYNLPSESVQFSDIKYVHSVAQPSLLSSSRTSSSPQKENPSLLNSHASIHVDFEAIVWHPNTDVK